MRFDMSLERLRVGRQREEKGRAASLSAFAPDPSAVSFDNHLTDHQTQTCSFVTQCFTLPPCRYFSKSWPISLAAIPTPLSLTHTWISVGSASAAPTSTAPPFSVNLIALLIKLLRTWSKRRGSA